METQKVLVVGLSEEEVKEAIRFVHKKFGSEVDSGTLRQTATLVLKRVREDHEELPAVRKDVLRSVPFRERQMYNSAIGKILSTRSVVHQDAVRRRRPRF